MVNLHMWTKTLKKTEVSLATASTYHLLGIDFGNNRPDIHGGESGFHCDLNPD